MKQLPSQSNTWILPLATLFYLSNPNSLRTTIPQNSTMLGWIYPFLYTCFHNQKKPILNLYPKKQQTDEIFLEVWQGKEEKLRKKRGGMYLLSSFGFQKSIPVKTKRAHFAFVCFMRPCCSKNCPHLSTTMGMDKREDFKGREERKGGSSRTRGKVDIAPFSPRLAFWCHQTKLDWVHCPCTGLTFSNLSLFWSLSLLLIITMYALPHVKIYILIWY